MIFPFIIDKTTKITWFTRRQTIKIHDNDVITYLNNLSFWKLFHCELKMYGNKPLILRWRTELMVKF